MKSMKTTTCVTLDCEMQNSNKSAVPLLEFMSKCNVEESLMFIYIHIFSY
jgi:hypothetical protein